MAKRKKAKQWEPCPRCGSKRIKVTGRALYFIATLMFASFMLMFGLFIWPLLIFAGIMFCITPLTLLIPAMKQCQDCKKMWRKNKDETTEA